MKNKYLFLLPLFLISFAFVSAIDISTCSELQNMSNNLAGNYVLVNDIDCSDTISWNGGAGFLPVGTFTGTLDGQGYTISDLYINKLGVSNIGLFKTISTTAIISNIKLENINIQGGIYTGGLVGRNQGGEIYNCSTSGIVLSNNSNIGGIVGITDTSSIIMNSYSTANVSGTTSVGGFVGFILSTNTVNNSYSTGYVNGTGGGFQGGGNLMVKNSFWDINTSGQATSVGGTGKTTLEMKDITTFSNAGWDIILNGNYVDETWFIDDSNDYPRLGFEYEPTIIQRILGVGKTTTSDTLVQQTELPFETQEPVVKLSIWQMFSNWFQNIINWFRNLFK